MESSTADAGRAPVDPHYELNMYANPMVGREPEQATLRSLLPESPESSGHFALIGGEAGIGKSALSQDLALEANRRGILVFSAYCFDREHAGPYAPWLDLCRIIGRSSKIGAQPPDAFRHGVLGVVTDRAGLYAEMQTFLQDAAHERPLLILLEDLHWADPASIEMLRFLAAEIATNAILLVGTYRQTEIGREHPLYRAIPALIRESGALRIDLRQLDDDALNVYLDRRYTLSPLDRPRLMRYLSLHSDGNPFFLTELLRALEQDGLLVQSGGRTALGALDRVVVPPLVRQVIDSRTARLDDQTRNALEIAALLGQHVPIRTWAELTGLSQSNLIDTIERLSDLHIIAADQDGTHFRFDHALTQEAIYAGIIPPKRRQWHGQIAEHLAEDGTVDPDIIALHFREAGDLRALIWWERAAERARRAYAWTTAAEMVREAIQALGDDNADLDRRRELMFRFAYFMRFSDPERGADAMAGAGLVDQRNQETASQAEIRFIRGILLFYAEHCAEGVSEMRAALDLIEEASGAPISMSPPVRMWAINLLSAGAEGVNESQRAFRDRVASAGFDSLHAVFPWYQAVSGQIKPALAMAQSLLSATHDVALEPDWTLACQAFAYYGEAVALGTLGDAAGATIAWSACHDRFARVDHFALLAFAQVTAIHDVAITYRAGDPAERRQLALATELSIGRAGGALRPGASPRLAWLPVLVLDGRWPEADAILANCDEPGNVILARAPREARAILAAARGHPEIAWDEIRRTLPQGAETAPGDCILTQGMMFQRLAARLALQSGEVDLAARWQRAHNRWEAETGALLGVPDARLLQGEICRHLGDRAEALRCASEAREVAVSLHLPLDHLRAARFLGRLALESGDLTESGRCLEESISLAETCEAAYERVLTLVERCRLLIERGEFTPAALDHAEIEHEILRLGAAPLIPISQSLAEAIAAGNDQLATPFGLTPRELETLRLVCQGHTDREIADTLFISPHTASTHVKHVLAKLGVSSRRAARAVATDICQEPTNT